MKLAALLFQIALFALLLTACAPTPSTPGFDGRAPRQRLHVEMDEAEVLALLADYPGRLDVLDGDFVRYYPETSEGLSSSPTLTLRFGSVKSLCESLDAFGKGHHWVEGEAVIDCNRVGQFLYPGMTATEAFSILTECADFAELEMIDERTSLLQAAQEQPGPSPWRIAYATRTFTLSITEGVVVSVCESVYNTGL